ncbi:MAG TPA: hypothetical protein VHN14_23880 [Kofleriaceae bacterium]|jgi:hypothetical protein|nr:hypothetical protein [Kofleriaceae bacterium]
MNIRALPIIAIGAFLAGIALFGQAGTASAAYRRVHSSQCHYSYDNAGSTIYNGYWLASYTTGHDVYCPVPSDSELSHAATTTLNVYGYSPTATGAYSKACVKAPSTAAYTCGALKYWASGYGGASGVSVATWHLYPTWLPVLYNSLPAGAALYGFYMT